MVRVRVSSVLEIAEFVENDHFVSVTDGPVRSVTTWAFAPTPLGTRVSFSGEYRVNGLPLPFLGEEILRHELSAHTSLSLRHLKRIPESQAAAADDQAAGGT